MKMKINNGNKTYTLPFMFSYEYSTYQIIKNPYDGKYQNITYQLMRRQET